MTHKSFTFSREVTIGDVYTVAHGATVAVSTQKKKEISKLQAELLHLSSQQTVYGINTGFGPMIDRSIASSDYSQLQYNLIRSHACGIGEPLPREMVRAVMFARLSSLLQGYSRISPDAITALESFLNQNITPVVPRHGSVGASGDLVQLAHVALGLIGEGTVVTPTGNKPTARTLRTHHISPLVLTGRDGLGLINGTSAMTGISALTLVDARQLLKNSIMCCALLYELFAVNTEHIHPIVSAARPHTGQTFVADSLRALLSTSKNARRHIDHTATDTSGAFASKKTQEIYSLRCVPQILGPIYETIENAVRVTEIELNAATDNPLFTSDEGAIHNGNFHGDYIAHEMDKVRIALTKLSMLMERQINVLVNPKVNGLLPPYLNRNTPGLDLALQAVQFVATSTTAENQTLAHPIVTHSIPTNNDNQDIVSMGCNSALLTQTVVENTFQVQSVLCVCLLEALDIQHTALTPKLGTFYTTLRESFPPLISDRPLTGDLERVILTLKSQGAKTTK